MLIKIIGAVFLFAGFVLLIVTVILGRKNNIKGAKQELSLIMNAGYVSEHAEAPRADNRLSYRNPVKAPPRKRTLSKEALDLLEEVEREREAERIRDMKQPKRGTTIIQDSSETSRPKGTSVLTDRSEKATSVLKEDLSNMSTAALMERSEKATSLLNNEKMHATGNLQDKQKAEYTDASRRDIEKNKRNNAPNKGTSVLPEQVSEENGTGVLPEKGTSVLVDHDQAEGRKGTSVLPPDTNDMYSEAAGTEKRPAVLPKKGTSVLNEEAGEDRKPITLRKKGTAILNEKPSAKGTSVLADTEGKKIRKEKEA